MLYYIYFTVFVIDDDDSDDDVEIISSTMPTGTNIIPGIVSWWDKDEKDDTTQFDPNFKNILKGSFEHMSSSSRSNFQARLTRASVSTIYTCMNKIDL